MTVKKILLVEDEAIIAMVTANTLKRFGYQVQIAYSGEDAVKLALAEDKPDLILMDIDLGPGMDGTEAARIILQEQEIPVVFHSAHTEKEIVDKTEEITSYGYIIKHSAPTVLQASIKMAFRLFDARMELKDREQHYRSLFEDAVGPIFIEDFSFVKQRYHQLIAEGNIEGPADFSLWLENHPEELDSFESNVIICDLNKAALRTLGRGETDKPKTLSECLGPEARLFFKDEVTAVALDSMPFEAEIPVLTANGATNYFFLQLSPIQGHEKDYSRVHVMLIDITETKKAKHY